MQEIVRRFLFYALVSAFCLPVSAETLIIGLEGTTPPYEFVDASGELRGFIPDFWRTVAGNLGMDAKFRTGTILDLSTMGSAGLLDVEGPMLNPRSPESCVEVPILRQSVYAFTYRSPSLVETKEELGAFLVGVVRNDAGEIWMRRNLPGVPVAVFEDFERLYEGFLAKTIRVALVNDSLFRQVLGRKQASNLFSSTGRPIGFTEFWIQYHNPLVKGRIDDAVKAMTRNELASLKMRWFGSSSGYRFPWPFIAFSVLTLLGIFGATIAWLWQANLKERILKATTELRESGNTLESTRAYLDCILDSIQSIVVAVGKDGIITRLNQPARAFLALSEGGEVSVYDHSPLFAQFRDTVLKAVSGRVHITLARFEHEIDGSTHWFSASIHPLPGEREEAVIVLSDVTEDEMKNRIVQRTQKMELVGNVAGGLAHDFNNIIGGIMGTASLMNFSIDAGEINPIQLKQDVMVIERQAGRASELVKRLLSLSRKHELSIRPVDLAAIISDTVSLCRNTFDKSVALDYFSTDELSVIDADPEQLEQVFLNVLMNASHACTFMRPEGDKTGGNVSVSLSRTPLGQIQLLHPEAKHTQWWTVTVVDNGIGMDEPVKARLFEPFFSTKGKNRGSGLGLSIVLHVVSQHSGLVDFDSIPGKGTTFRIHFPESHGDPNEDGFDESGAIPRRSGHILMADDEEVIRSTAGKMLTACGYTVTSVEDGNGALERFTENSGAFDLVILDMAMPGMDGKETYYALRNVNSRIPILVSSGYRNDPRVEEILAAGAAGFLQKPYRLKDMSETLLRLLPEVKN